jgi:L-threonylcarbamoyladenylate synthase
METQVIRVNPISPEPEAIERAAEIIRAGELVAFPTETVYGLGANALDSAAVAKVFKAKGRPSANPLIVHVPKTSSARQLVSEWPDFAQKLAERFWPGPLTLVLRKSSVVPNIVTAGGPTVAVRCPMHAVALALLRESGVPLAAPSANRSSRISPTHANHVVKSLGGLIPMVLDAGPCPGGVESTVIDLTASCPSILRPGLLSREELVGVIGTVDYTAHASHESSVKSPGLLDRHYAPDARLVLAVPAEDERLVREACARGERVGWLALPPWPDNPALIGCIADVYEMPGDSPNYARRLYYALHELDEWGADLIVVTTPPDSEEWRAVRDRLSRAAHRDADAGE